jgi:hypothetical protein
MISRDVYVPQTLHTRCETFNSPHCSHFTMPGTTNLKCVRRLCLRAFDVFAKGTANAATSLFRSERRLALQAGLILAEI